MDEAGIGARLAALVEAHLDTAVGKRLQLGGDRDAAAIAANDAGAAILRFDRHALVDDRAHCRRPRAVESLLLRGTDGDRLVHDAAAESEKKEQQEDEALHAFSIVVNTTLANPVARYRISRNAP